jgi:hypothetical protein
VALKEAEIFEINMFALDCLGMGDILIRALEMPQCFRGESLIAFIVI